MINLDNPFTYDPASGDLLVDIMKFSGEFDTVNFDAQSTLAVTTIFSNDVFSSQGGTLEEVYVANLTVVPEPFPVSLVLLGCVSLAPCRRWTK